MSHEINLKEYEFVTHSDSGKPVVLGRGAFSVVYLLSCRRTGTYYALKNMLTTHMKEDDRYRCKREVDLLSSLNHNHIIPIKGANVLTDSIDILMPFCNKGSLYDFIKKQEKFIDNDIIINILKQVTSAVAFLHQNGYLHRDVSSSNILISSMHPIHVYISDLGLAKELTSDAHQTMVGTPLYSSPEIFLGSRYDYSADVYSLGVVYYELMTLEHPFPGTRTVEVKEKVLKGEHLSVLDINPNVPIELATIVERMLSLDRKKRPSADELINLDVFNNVRECQQVSPNIDIHKEEERVPEDMVLRYLLYVIKTLFPISIQDRCFAFVQFLFSDVDLNPTNQSPCSDVNLLELKNVVGSPADDEFDDEFIVDFLKAFRRPFLIEVSRQHFALQFQCFVILLRKIDHFFPHFKEIKPTIFEFVNK
ncbi:hypothetical protein P9112_003806 [Eukaryota sp. TZLM1-RC]